MKKKDLTRVFSIFAAAAVVTSLGACNSVSTLTDATDTSENTENTDAQTSVISADDIVKNSEMSSTNDSEHVIEVDGEKKEYSNVKITKSGDSDQGDEADFYGDNAAIFATNGATLSLNEMIIDTNGTHANAVFSYGEGTTVNISNSVITTSGNCSGGLMTTGGGTMNATNLSVHTTGNSSAAIRSDRGGGVVTVTGGEYTTDGTGSPTIYSTADITVNNAALTSTASQGVVVEGQNSVTLNDVDLTADNNTKNSDKSDYYQTVMIYQSMSGDADEGTASFTMNGGSITNKNGDVFFVNNTVANINLSDVQVINQDEDGVFLRAEAAGWGSEGSNGGNVNLTISNQVLEGDMVVDEISGLNFTITDNSSYFGVINGENEGNVYVEIEDGSTWDLTGDSYVTSLTCGENAVRLNGYKLYVDGVEYKEGSASSGSKVEFMVSTGGHGANGDVGKPEEGGAPGRDGEAPLEKPDGNGGPGMDGNAPPEKPDGNGGPEMDGKTPPDKPE